MKNKNAQTGDKGRNPYLRKKKPNTEIMKKSSLFFVLTIFSLYIYGQNNVRYNTVDGGLDENGTHNSFFGYEVGENNPFGTYNSVFGNWAGNINKGSANVFMGFKTGYFNTTGSANIFIGYEAGYSNSGADNNSFMGYKAGYQNTAGSGNVFIGYTAGYHETGSNKLYIDNDSTSSPLIYGDFANDFLRVNGNIELGNANQVISTSRGRLAFSSTTDWNHSIYNNYAGMDGEGSWDGMKFNVYGGASFRVGNAAGVTPVTALHINSAANVGIGTKEPTSKLDVRGDISLGHFFDNTTFTPVRIGKPGGAALGDPGSAYVQFDDVANTGTSISFYTHKYNVGTSEAFRIDANGNLKLGSTNKVISTNRGRINFSTTTSDWNHTIYNNYDNLDGEGSWDGMKFNVYGGASFRVGNASGVTPVTALHINESGNVGIGTTQSLIDLAIGDSDTGFKQQGDNTIAIYTDNAERLRVDENGNVGIGTTSIHSNFKMQIKGGDGDWKGGIASGGDSTAVVIGELYNKATIGGHSAGLDGWATLLINPYGGNVGIGTANPQSKLAVNGKITTKEVEVTPDGWADFVFAEDYNLPALEEVEAHINTHKHLPGVPSAQEVLENGIELGKMNATLLQKIEELTLYVIDLKKELEEVKNVNE